MQSVTSILADIAAGRLSTRGAVERSLDAIEETEPEVLAFERLADHETLLKAAETAAGPLAGLAIGVKDIFDTHDLETCYGSPIYAGHRPLADAAIVAMARRAGGAVVGKTVTTEFAYFHPGKTRNPHDAAHTPGGSSSGSAAAVAAGMIPAAIGTQTGGSIIRPAAFCGVAGFKPSFRLLPATGMKTFSWALDTVGLFAAGVADVAAFAAGLTGRSLTVEPVDPSALRIGLYRSAIWNEASPDMRAAVEGAARAAADAGATVIELEEPETLAAGREAHATIQNFEAGLSLASDFALHGGRMSAKLRETIEEGQAIAPADYDAARSTAKLARREAIAMFEEVDVLLKPSAPGAAPRGLEATGSPLFNKLWSLTGSPCVNVPGLGDASGLPLGLQVVARFGRDRVALSAAAWLEGLLRERG